MVICSREKKEEEEGGGGRTAVQGVGGSVKWREGFCFSVKDILIRFQKNLCFYVCGKK